MNALGRQFNGFGLGLGRLRFREQWGNPPAEVGIAQRAQKAGKCRAQAGKKSRLSLVFHIKADGTATASWAYRPLQPHGTPIIAWGTSVFCGKGSRGKIAAVLIMWGRPPVCRLRCLWLRKGVENFVRRCFTPRFNPLSPQARTPTLLPQARTPAILILAWRGRSWKLALDLRWPLSTSLLEIPCSILDIQEHSRGGAESAEAEIFLAQTENC